jgi:isocitrate lyase
MTALEMQIEQRRRLIMLLRIKAGNNGVENKALDRMITDTKAEMQQEDVVWVETKIAETP